MARAIAKYIRMSPRKLRRVINVIRGKEAQNAKTVLKFMPYAAARVVEKVLKSAISNAKENDKQNPNGLRITKAFVDQSSTLRRWRAMSRGRGFPILKRTSHVTIEVSPDLDLIGKELPSQGKTTKYKKHTHDHGEHAHDHEHDHESGAEHEHKHEKKASLKETKTKKEVKGKTKETTKKKDKKGKEKEE